VRSFADSASACVRGRRTVGSHADGDDAATKRRES